MRETTGSWRAWPERAQVVTDIIKFKFFNYKFMVGFEKGYLKERCLIEIIINKKIG